MAKEIETELPEDRQEIFDTILQQSRKIALERDMQGVNREISFYVLLKSYPKMIGILTREFGMDAKGLFLEMNFKYNHLSYTPFKQDDGDNWKASRKSENNIKPDNDFMMVLGKHLLNKRIQNIPNLMVSVIVESSIDGYNNYGDEIMDPLYYTSDYNGPVPDENWTRLLDKYFVGDDENELLYFQMGDPVEEEEPVAQNKADLTNHNPKTKPGFAKKAIAIEPNSKENKKGRRGGPRNG